VQTTALVTFLTKVILGQKLFQPLFFSLLLLFLISYLFIDVNIGEPLKLFIDVNLSIQHGILHLIALMSGFILLTKFHSGALSLIPLTLPLSRLTVLLNLYLSLFTIITLLTLLLALIDGIIFSLLAPQFLIPLFIQLLLFTLSAMLLSTLLLTISWYSTPLKALFWTIALFLIGHGLDELLLFLKHDETSYFLGILLFYLLPNFTHFDFINHLSNQQTAHFLSYVINALFYLFSYGLFLIGVAFVRFKSMKVLPNDT